MSSLSDRVFAAFLFDMTARLSTRSKRPSALGPLGRAGTGLTSRPFCRPSTACAASKRSHVFACLDWTLTRKPGRFCGGRGHSRCRCNRWCGKFSDFTAGGSLGDRYPLASGTCCSSACGCRLASSKEFIAAEESGMASQCRTGYEALVASRLMDGGLLLGPHDRLGLNSLPHRHVCIPTTAFARRRSTDVSRRPHRP